MKQKTVAAIFFVGAVVALLAVPAAAATRQAASCRASDVQAAVDAAASGDEVRVPAGTCTWGGGVSVPDHKKLTLRGAGVGKTVIRMDSAAAAFDINDSGSRVTGFEVVFDNTDAVGVLTNGANNWVVDNCRFVNRSTKAYDSSIGVYANADDDNEPGGVNGLVHSCRFENSKVLVIPYRSKASMSDEWYRPLRLGTGDAVYIEDSEFVFTILGNSVDTNYGGKIVARFNTFTDSQLMVHSLQMGRGTKKFEVYGNTFTGTSSNKNAFGAMWLRGGTGVIFDNAVNGRWTNAIMLDNKRSYEDKWEYGSCDGDSPADGNRDSTGWPCRDQIGRGPDTRNMNDTGGYPSQQDAPLYVWQNRKDGKLVSSSIINNSQRHIKADRDYFEQEEDFNGFGGVGVGPLAERPAACSTGSAWWATDRGQWNQSGTGGQGVLYKCTSPNNWQVYYTPYTYPHPLRTGGSVGQSPDDGGELQPPRGLRIIE